ncbi:gliding motility protein GldN [Hallella sp.]|uniref:type IX secretion system ring protein PorN/GldN n=1 Tax=Hallella TaxID=52228 RepID=UPI00258B9F3E|nr:gliding motility protein GldN [Hallella sp.]MBS7399352.1 gliding motility protein GldN [Prevotella sp.]MDD7145360.1 gliding motility protein GldN [Hallella sp.]MDR4000331.1 gliding motility protein GldN [Hallella sp.]MED9946030.1 gliding motility protein GldN [Hallella sp.]
MRRLIFIIMIGCFCMAAQAQPEARRQQQQAQAAKKSNANNMTTRAQISFPTEAKMAEDVVWRRDVYRELDLNDDANAGLYYPTEPVGTQMNLFTYLFKLIMAGPRHGGIAAYSYDVNSGNERFDESLRIQPLKFLDDYHIFYERGDRGVHIDDSDIPSAEVKGYFIKESAYFDQVSATFHTKVQAICPVMYREDDFGDGVTKYPLFWVKYDDLAPFLSKQTIMTSNLNNAATMSLDDYFTTNAYRGKIYKTTNMLGKTLAQVAGGDTAKLSREQSRIEKEIERFEQNVWGDKARKDSVDSIAKLDKKQLKAVKNKSKNRRTTQTTVKRTRRSSSPSTSSAARVTVRRQRH